MAVAAWLQAGSSQQPLGTDELALTWMGAAALEARTQAATVLIDPFYTREGLWTLLSGPIKADPARIDRYVRRPDAVLVSHAHYDHFLDGPYIAKKYRVPIYLPPDAEAIALAEGVATADVHVLRGGERLTFGDMTVDVIKTHHPDVFTQIIVGGPMPVDFQLPMRYSRYRTADDFDFVINWRGRAIAHVDAPDSLSQPIATADVAFVSVGAWWSRPRVFAKVRTAFSPGVLIPMHHDDFFKPLSEPMVENAFSVVAWAMPEIRADLPETEIRSLTAFFQEFRLSPAR